MLLEGVLMYICAGISSTAKDIEDRLCESSNAPAEQHPQPSITDPQPPLP